MQRCPVERNRVCKKYWDSEVAQRNFGRDRRRGSSGTVSQTKHLLVFAERCTVQPLCCCKKHSTQQRLEQQAADDTDGQLGIVHSDRLRCVILHPRKGRLVQLLQDPQHAHHDTAVRRWSRQQAALPKQHKSSHQDAQEEVKNVKRDGRSKRHSFVSRSHLFVAAGECFRHMNEPPQPADFVSSNMQ